MKIEVSIGEIVDKLSILQIKKDNITDEVKLENINKEYVYLHEIVFSQLKINYNDDYSKLLDVNKSLWIIEDKLRDKERDKSFDDDFIQLSRSVYFTNDKRAEIKKEINITYGSLFVEEKSYSNYK
jgi:hypothetical protein